MPLTKQLLQVTAADGLGQKFDPLSLPMGKSAKAQNLEKVKSGALTKRLGFWPLQKSDPFGSQFTLSSGISLGTWNDGSVDNLWSIGQGNRPNTTAPATVLQAYSDDLGGPVNRGYAPDIKIVQDSTTSGSIGSTFAPCGVTVGDIMVTCWIDPAADFNSQNQIRASQPLGPVGTLIWSATQLSTGQQIVGPSVVDAVAGNGTQYFRLAQCNGTWIVCYSVSANQPANPFAYNGMIMAKTMSSITTGWTPGPNSLGTVIIGGGGQPANAAWPNPYGTQNAGSLPTVGFPLTNGVVTSGTGAPAGAFDMKAVVGDANYFVIAYETGAFTPPSGGGPSFGGTAGFWTGSNIVVDRRNISAPQTIVATWTVQAAPAGISVAGGFGVLAQNPNTIGVSWSYAGSGGGYTEYAAIGNYPAMTTLKTPSIIYQSQDGFEIQPSWCDVSFSPTTGLFTTSHSPMGSVWNAALTAQNAVRSGGSGATATVNSLNGRVIGLPVIQGTNIGFYNSQTTGPSVVFSPPGTPAASYYPQNGSTQGMGAPLGLGQVNAAFPQSFPAGEGGGFSSAPKATAVGGTLSGNASPAQFGTPQMLYSINTGTGSTTINTGGTGYATSTPPLILFGDGGPGTGAAATVSAAYAYGPITNFTITNTGSGYTSPPIVTIRDRAGYGSGAVVTVSVGGSSSSIGNAVIVNAGQNYLGPIDVFFSGGAQATANVVNGSISTINVTNGGANYPSAPDVLIVDQQNLVGLQQQQANRIVNSGTDNAGHHWSYPSNDARVIQNQWYASAGSSVALQTTTCQGNVSGIGNAVITPGVTLASNALTVNGMTYFLCWEPSGTQGGFLVMAFDLAATTISGALTGNGFPMRPVGAIQTRTALCDPGWGYQQNPSPAPSLDINGTPTVPQAASQGWVYQAPVAPNCWTGGSWWNSTGDVYGTAYLAYVSSSQGGRLSPAFGQIQTLPRQGYPSTTFGNVTAIGGALPSIYDGQNVFEQGFPWTVESVIATISTSNANIPTNASLTWTNPTDSYTWIFQWEQFDAQGNFHRSARQSVTISGQNILDAQGPGTAAFPPVTALPYSGAVTFTVPALGATNRMWPQTNNPGDFGNDIRALASRPTAPITLGAYRTALNSQVFYRIYDRYFDGDDIGDTGFSLPPLVSNSLSAGCTVSITDGLNDTFLTGATAAAPFPLLDGDGTNGNPGYLDDFCPPASNVCCKHKERLFVARGNVVYYTKQKSELVGPGFNDALFTIFVGGDDPITGLASLDDKLIILKLDSIYYVAGDGPNDDGSGNSFTAPQPIPTDGGCNNPNSVASTPEGVYFQSNAGLRILTRALAVEYVGGPVEDELSANPIVQGVTLYPSNNRVIFLANTADTPAASGANSGQLTGELLVRDYILDAWTTSLIANGAQTPGFASAAVAWGNGQTYVGPPPLFLPRHQPPQLHLHLIAADGQIWREHDTRDDTAYFDNGTYVSWTWVSSMIRPSEAYQGRFRLWDIIALLRSNNPHGLIITSSIDYINVAGGLPKKWVWNTPGSPSIAPNGLQPTAMTQLRAYDGRMGEAFQIMVQDISDPNSTTGEGADLIGLTLGLGVYPGPTKLPASATQ